MSGEQPPTSRPRALRGLLLLCAALVAHGSLYPWQFHRPVSLRYSLQDMLLADRWWTSPGDVIGNVVLFVPLGALGQWVLQAGLPRRAAAAVVLAGGTVFALALQLAQLFLPWRDAALADVLWNAVGLVLGSTAAVLAPAARLGFGGAMRPTDDAAATTARLRMAGVMALLWLALQWWPFVPTLDWQQVKDASKGLWQRPFGSPGAVCGTALAVVVLAHLLRPLELRARALGVLCTFAVIGKLFAAGQWLSGAHAAGVVLGAAAGAAGWRMPEALLRRCLLVLAVAWFTADAMRPWRLAPVSGPFVWQPFVALLYGSMLTNLLALCWNLFWIGAAVLLAGPHPGRPRWRDAAALATGVLVLELVQTRLPGRVADITPALLPALWWLAVRAALPAAPRS